MNNLPVNVVDLVVIGVLLLSGLLALSRGFVHEVLAMAAWVGAAFATLYGLPTLRPVARQYISLGWAADAAAGAVLFLGTLLVASLVTHAISRQVRRSGLNSVDRSLGFVFGLARGAVVVCLAYMLLAWVTEPEPPQWLAAARTRPLLAAGAEFIRSLAPEEFRGKAASHASEAQEQARRAMDLERTYRELASPRPKAPDQPGTAGGPMPGPANGTNGYDQTSRRDMDRLFKSNQ